LQAESLAARGFQRFHCNRNAVELGAEFFMVIRRISVTAGSTKFFRLKKVIRKIAQDK
jgi:hypothetical protein